jgi:hypothetical protein
MNQVQCRVDVLRCQSVGGLTPARAFWKSYNGICLYMTQFYLTSSHTAVLQWNYGWKSWLGFEEGLWGWGVAIVTGDGCPHESLTMNDPSLSLRHTHTQQSIHKVISLPTYTLSKTSKPSNSTICGFVWCRFSSGYHSFILTLFLHIYKLLFIYTSVQFLPE